MKPNASPVDLQETFLEPLEARIAPASATFTDADGDIITVWTSKGTAQNIMDVVTGGANSEIENIALTDNAIFQGTSIKVYVSGKVAGGDGLANVWRINADGMDLGSVEVTGDLAKLQAGDANFTNGSVKSVKVQSIGVNGGATDKIWFMQGSTNTFTVAGDVEGATLAWNADTSKVTISKLTIGGNLIGGDMAGRGSVTVTAGTGGMAEIKTLFVGGNLEATNFDRTGSILVGNPADSSAFGGKIGTATIGGSLIGKATYNYAGTLYASTSLGQTSVVGSLVGGGEGGGSIYVSGIATGAIKIGGSLQGGDELESGSVIASFGFKSVEVGGSITGTSDARTGSILAMVGAGGDVKIGTYMQGGSANHTGAIYARDGLGDVWVGGTVFGDGMNTATEFSGGIGTDDTATAQIGDVTILGSLIGGKSSSSGGLMGGNFGNISISGSIEANAGSLGIYANTATSIYIGGDIEGGTTNYNGAIRIVGTNANVASITVEHDVLGNSGNFSGAIEVAGKVSKLFIGGDLVGGSGTNSARLSIGGDAGSVTIGGDLDGAAGPSSASLVLSGKVGALKVGGHVLGDTGANSASITVAGDTGSLFIGGDVVGSGTMGLNSAKVVLKNLTSGFINGSILGGAEDFTGYVEFLKGGTFTVGGGILGNDGDFSGHLKYDSLNKLDVGTIGFNGSSLYGGNGESSGAISGSLATKKAVIAGDVFGGGGLFAGAAALGNIGDATIGGDVIGGGGIGSGRILGAEVTGKFVLNGNVIGNTANSNNSGSLGFGASVKSLEIKGSIIGGTATMSNVSNRGTVMVFGHLNSLTVGGIVGGTAFDKSDTFLGGVYADSIGTMVVKGDVTGNTSQYVPIVARGDITKTSGPNLAIKSLTINGSTSYANILGGYNSSGNMLDGAGGNDGGSAQLGTITVLGDFMNSSIATGVSSNNANLNHWADGNNELLAKPTGSNIVASIAKIVIKGASFANVQNGFAAELVKSLNIGGFNIPVPAGAQNFQVSGGNYKVQQVVA